MRGPSAGPRFRASPTCQSIRGLLEFLGRRPDNRFMQTVRRRILAIAFSLALLASLSSGGSGRAATDRTAEVVVITSGVVPEGEGFGSGEYGYAEYWLVLRNRSANPGAIDVTDDVQEGGDQDRTLRHEQLGVTLLPDRDRHFSYR